MAVLSKPFDRPVLFSYANLVHAIAGGCGSSIAMSTFYPLDIVRTKLQLDDKRKSRNTLATLMEVYEEEGMFGLYRGLLPVIKSLYCSNFVYFYTFHALKGYFNREKSVLKDLLLGMLAGWVNVLTTTPLWVVNTRIKTQGTKSTAQKKQVYKGLIDGLIKIGREEGPFSLWAGTSSSLVLAINPAIQFMTYEALKRRLGPLAGSKGLPVPLAFLVGATAKAIATVLTYPLQLVQTKQRHGHNYPDLPPKPGVIALMSYILRLYGPAGLFKGLEAKILQTVLTAALMFVYYEKIANFVFKMMRAKKNL